MSVHIELDGAWAECPAPGVCELKFHFTDMTVEAARQMPLEVLVSLLEVVDPPSSTGTSTKVKVWTVPGHGGTPLKHRDYDLPARIWADGRMEWWLNGQRNRAQDRPTDVWPDGVRKWHRNGVLHREGGKPAVINADGREEYWQDGIPVDADGERLRPPSLVYPASISSDMGLWNELQTLALDPEEHTMPLGKATRSPWRHAQARCKRGGKYSFRTRKLALTRLNELRVKGVAVTQVYRCSACKKWHLTSHTYE